jgi:glycosyltransferase involved in cell wall biosynthesis
VSARIRILIVDHAAVESARRLVYRKVADRAEFEVHLLVPNRWWERGHVISAEEERGTALRLHTSGFLLGYRFHRVIYMRLFRALREIQPHFVYVDAEPENYAAVEAIVARRLLAPSAKLALVSSRNLDHRKIGFPYKLSFTHRFCDAFTLKHRVDLFVIRPKAAAQLIAPYAKEVRHIPFSVDCSQFKRDPARGSGLNRGDERQVVIGFLGRLIEGKGVRILVESLPHLPERVKLLIVGGGPLLENLQSLARKLRIDQKVSFHPPVPYTEVPDVLNKMDVLVLPSLDTKYWVEQCPRVLIEAMACEVPIVASQSGGIPDVIGDAGLLFRVANREDLVEKLSQIVNDPSLRAELARKGRARALELYDVPVIADRMADAILNTLRS